MKAKVVTALLVSLFSVQAFAQNNVIDEVVWVVGDEAILKSDVESERLNAQYEGRRFDGDPYCVIPEQLAVQKLFLHQAEIDSIEVSDQDVLAEVEMRTNWFIDQMGSKEKMEEYFNKTSSQIREMLRETVRNSKLVQKMQQQIIGDVKLVPADVRRYFNNLPQDSIPYVPTQVEVQIITVEPKIPQEEIDRVKKTLRDYTERVESGDVSFSLLARMYSEDPGSARRGGEYGFQSRSQLVPEFANVVFNMTDPKKISKVFETEYGYHIIKREPLLEDYPETNVEHIQQNIQSTEFQQMLDKWNTEAVVIGNKPVFDKIDVGAVLGEYLADYDETLELIRQEFMKAEGDLE